MMGNTHEHLEDADWLHLDDSEQLLWTGRPSRYTIAVSIALAAVLVIVGVALTSWLLPILEGSVVPSWFGFTPLSLTVYGIIKGMKTYLRWRRHLYVVTDDGVYLRYGLISRDITQVPGDRIQNTSFNQSILGRALSFGDVEVFTAGSSREDVTFENVPNPQSVTEVLTTTQTEREERDRERAV